MPTVPTLPIPNIDRKPFYASVGAGDAAIERLRARVTALPAQLRDVPAQLRTVPAQLASLPVRAQALPTTLQKQRAEFGTKAEKLYEELAARGEKVVTELRGGAKPSTAS